jgi:glucokinase
MAILRGGIDLGGTKIQTVVVDGNNKVRGEARSPTPSAGGPPDVAAAMAAAMRDAAAEAKAEAGELEGVGVGAPGDADPNGFVSAASNLPGWEGSFPLADRLQQDLGCPVRVGGDVQVATEAEFRLGAGKPYGSILGVFWGTGVGGGLVLDGRPWTGRGNAGEIGHMVVKRGGARCPCGRRGCLEAYAGRGAMEERARREHEDGTKTDLFKIMERRGDDRLKSGVWEEAIKAGDKLATRLIDRALKALGAGIASAVNLLDPEAVIVGGGLGTRFGPPYVERIEKRMHKHLFVDDRPPAIHVAELGDLGGAIGAALLVTESRG